MRHFGDVSCRNLSADSLASFLRDAGSNQSRALVYASTLGFDELTEKPSIVIFPGLSYGTDVSSDADSSSSLGWWESIVGPGRPIDTRRYLVHTFGLYPEDSCGPKPDNAVLLGPSSLCISAFASLVRDHLGNSGVRKIDALIGTSFGSLPATELACLTSPFTIDRLVFICGGITHTPYTLLLRSITDTLLNPRSGISSNLALRLSRQMSLLLYGSPSAFERRQETIPLFDPIHWADRKADKHSDRFSPDYTRDLNRMALLAPEFLSLDSLQRNHPNLTVHQIVCPSDVLYGIVAAKNTRRLLDEHGVHTLESIFASLDGHDAFLTDQQRLAPLITETLRKDIAG